MRYYVITTTDTTTDTNDRTTTENLQTSFCCDFYGMDGTVYCRLFDTLDLDTLIDMVQ